MTIKTRRVVKADIAKAGGVPQLIASLVESLIKGGEEQMETSAMLLRSLTEQVSLSEDKTSNSQLIAEAGGVPPLVHLVEVGLPEGQTFALDKLAHIAHGRPEQQQAILDAGGVKHIARCLKGGGAPVQAAAAALCSVSELKSTQSAFIQAGVVPCLVSLLKGGSVVIQIYAAQALANLAEANPDGQLAIGKAGAIPLLIPLLESGKAQEAAASAIQAIAEGNDSVRGRARHSRPGELA